MTPSPPNPIVPIPPATTLSYEQSAQLMSDYNFQGRIKTACLKFAAYIMNEPSNVTAHNARLKWAASCYQNPNMVAQQVQPPTVMDPNVQTQGSAIDDATLQTAVEEVVQELI